MEKYNLGWNTFKTHLAETSRELYQGKLFADVTLVSDDMIQTPAHRTVLSGASGVFKRLLMLNPSAQPLLFLKGVQHEELESILEFIYLGEAKVSECRIEEFARVALELDIKELNQSQRKSNFEETNSQLNLKDTYEVPHKSDIKEANPPNMSQTVPVRNFKKGEVDHQVYQRSKTVCLTSVNSFSCDQCEKSYTEPRSLRRHIESAHEKVSFTCDQCNKQFSYKESLMKHIESVHSKQSFKCGQCDKQYTQRDNLQRHVKSSHFNYLYT